MTLCKRGCIEEYTTNVQTHNLIHFLYVALVELYTYVYTLFMLYYVIHATVSCKSSYGGNKDKEGFSSVAAHIGLDARAKIVSEYDQKIPQS